MARKISDKGLRKKLDDIIREKVRERDKWCQWCGKSNSLQVSHVIPKGRSTYLRWDMQNVKLLCAGCHLNEWHGKSKGRAWFDKKFPKRAKYVDSVWRTTVKKRSFMLEKLEELQ